MLLIVFAAQLFAADEPDIVALEKGYKIEAARLEKCLAERFADPQTCAEVLYEYRKAHKVAFPNMENTEGGLKLLSISASPPFLKQDPNDLYRRFHSALVFRFRRLYRGGSEVDHNPHDVTLPVYADPKMQWAFPTCGDAIAAATEACNKTALALLTIKGNIEAKKLEIRRLKKNR